jgi:hypothetical protein
MGGQVVQEGAKVGSENNGFQALVCPSRTQTTAICQSILGSANSSVQFIIGTK